MRWHKTQPSRFRSDAGRVILLDEWETMNAAEHAAVLELHAGNGRHFNRQGTDSTRAYLGVHAANRH
jgi:hypothetical protein